MNGLLRRILGSYEITLSGSRTPEFINACLEKDLFFYSPLPRGDEMTIRASLFSCEKIIRLADEYGICAEITDRTGVPFLISRYRRRYGIMAGLIVSAVLLFASTQFLWDVRVTGNVKVSESEILTVLKKHGVADGTYIPGLDVDLASEYILIDYHDLSSLSINIKGTVAYVDVIERVPMPDPIIPEGYCSLVASADGIVTRVEAAAGHPEVSAGQVVTEGQLLVNGIVENSRGAYRLVNAYGFVYADVRHEYTVEIPLTTSEKRYTGSTETKTQISLIGMTANLFVSETPSFEYCDATACESDIVLLGFLRLPLTVSKTVFREYIPEEITVSPDTARSKAYAQYALIEEEIDGDIMSTEFSESFDNENGVYVLTAHVVVNENIAVRSEIEFIDPRIGRS